MRESYEDYVKRVVPLIIEKSDELAHSGLNDTQKKLHSLILNVFSFSANALDKLDEETKAEIKPTLDMIEDHLRQRGKIDPNL